MEKEGNVGGILRESSNVTEEANVMGEEEGGRHILDPLLPCEFSSEKEDFFIPGERFVRTFGGAFPCPEVPECGSVFR